MANRTVQVLRAFAGIGKDGSGSRYFTRDDGHLAEEFLSVEEFAYRLAQGFISVDEIPDPVPLRFVAPTDAASLEMGKVGGDFSKITAAPVSTERPLKGLKPSTFTAEK